MSAEKMKSSVLIVSSSEKDIESFSKLLPSEQFSPIISALNAVEAKRTLSNTPTDIVIISTPLSDELGVQLSVDISNNYTTGVLLFVKSDLYEQVSSKVEDYGVLTLQRPTNKQTVVQSVKLLVATRAKLKTMLDKTITLESKMEEILIVNRAKLVLIEQHKMSEAQAHRYIEKRAMDTCVKRREIAEDIIRTYEN